MEHKNREIANKLQTSRSNLKRILCFIACFSELRGVPGNLSAIVLVVSNIRGGGNSDLTIGS